MSTRLPPLPTIRDLLKLYKLRALKQLSQNFLLDQRITDRIVRAAGKIQGNHVCEVGPGPGGITRSIIQKCPETLTVVEKDPRFLPTLELLREVSPIKINIEISDILTYNFKVDCEETPWLDRPPPVHLIGNLPFSVSTHLLITWLEQISKHTGPWSYGRTKMTLTFQKEVAERIVAPIMSSQRCRLSVIAQNYCRPEHRFNIPGTAFTPKPDVDVGVVTLTPLKYPISTQPFPLIEKVLRAIFNMRQKYALRGAEMLFPEDVRMECRLKLFEMADVDPQTRPFQITNLEFSRIFDAYAQLCVDFGGIRDYDFRACKKVNVI